LVADLEAYMREQCAKLSRGHDLAKAMNYMFKRWGSFTRFLDDGRVCLSNNAAERALRGIIGQKVVVILRLRPRRASRRRDV
jgi:transposase